jgi:hypothetical protein
MYVNNFGFGNSATTLSSASCMPIYASAFNNHRMPSGMCPVKMDSASVRPVQKGGDLMRYIMRIFAPKPTGIVVDLLRRHHVDGRYCNYGRSYCIYMQARRKMIQSGDHSISRFSKSHGWPMTSWQRKDVHTLLLCVESGCVTLLSLLLSIRVMEVGL